MQNKQVRFGPIAVPSSVGNLLNPPAISGGVNPPANSTATYFLIKHIRILNKSAGAVTFTGYIGATGGSAAGTEVLGGALSISANSYVDFYPGNLRLDVADFFTGVASAATSLVIEGSGEMGVAG